MQLGCDACGATLMADESALRRALAVCRRCNSILRLDADEAPPAPMTEPEPGVWVERLGDDALKLTALRPRSAWALNNLTSTAAWSAGVAAAAACTAHFGGAAAIAGVPIGLTAFVLAAKLQRRLRPLELNRGIILPSDPHQKPLAMVDVQQVYAAECHLDLGGDSALSTANVFALTHGGERVLLIGPVEDTAVARRIEKFLCAELGLDRQPAGRWVRTPDRAATPVFACEACGATLSPEANETRRGIASCGECTGVSRLARGRETHPREPRRYHVRVEADGVTIEPIDDRHPSCEIHEENLTLRCIGRAPIGVRLRDVLHVRVSEAEAHRFEVVLEHATRGAIPLTSLLTRSDEAFEIAQVLREAFAKAR